MTIKELTVLGALALAVLLPFAWRDLDRKQRVLAVAIALPVMIVLLIGMYI